MEKDGGGGHRQEVGTTAPLDVQHKCPATATHRLGVIIRVVFVWVGFLGEVNLVLTGRFDIVVWIFGGEGGKFQMGFDRFANVVLRIELEHRISEMEKTNFYFLKLLPP